MPRLALVAAAGLLAGSALALGTALVASDHGTPGTTVSHVAVRPATEQEVPTTPSPADPWADLSAEPVLQDDVHAPIEDLPVLTQIWLADKPTGTGPEIALRFLQALQRHDDLAADRELYSVDRQWFSGEGRQALRQAMNEVRHNAGLEHTAPCTDAMRLNVEAALVRCGPVRVVVHVLHDELASGVQIGDWSFHQDVYRGPHTHAVTPNLP